MSAPPRSGGDLVRVVRSPIDVPALLAAVAAPGLGAVTSFLGSVRSPNGGVEVAYIDYEGYEGMMLAEMRRLVDELRARHELGRVAVVHRLGRLRAGDVSMAVAVGSAHRADALAGCREAVEGLKARLPV